MQDLSSWNQGLNPCPWSGSRSQLPRKSMIQAPSWCQYLHFLGQQGTLARGSRRESPGMTFPRDDICLLIPLRSVPQPALSCRSVGLAASMHNFLDSLCVLELVKLSLSLSHWAHRSVPLYPQHCGGTRICNISSISSRKASWLSCILCHSIQGYMPIFCPFILLLQTSQRPFLQPQVHQFTYPSPSVNSRNLEGHNCVSLFVFGWTM